MNAPVASPAPPPVEVHARAGARVPAWLAGAVLIAGLAVVATIAAVSGVSLVAQHHIQAGAAGLHVVGKMYVPGWTSPEYNPFVEHRLRVITPLLTIAYLLSATALGSVLVGAMRGSSRWPLAVRLLAGFLPGYLMLLGPLQLLFAAVPLVPAAWLALLGVTATAAAVHGRGAVAATRRLRDDAAGRRRLVRSSAVIAGILVLAGLHRIQMGYNFMVTDSISVFLAAAKDQLAGGFGQHLAQWDQQSDEWIFNAPLMFTSHAGRDYLFPLYATQFVGLASFGCLAFGIVHSFASRHRRLAAGLATAVVLLATPAIFPWFYAPLIGGHNPVAWLGHPGRFIAIAAPWVALLLLRRQGRGATIAIGLATVGLGFVTLHATVYVLAMLGAALCWTMLRGRALRDRAPLTLGASFLLVDFTGASMATAWILTRFLEVPFYGLLGLAAITFVGARDRVTKWVGVGVLAAWSAVPIVVNLVPLQLVRNAHWLARVIVG
jgi:hypothetical protein